MFDNFTNSTKELIYQAQNIAVESHNTLIEPIHLLYSMSLSSTDSVVLLMTELKLNTNLFNQDIKNILNNLPKTSEITDKIYSGSSVFDKKEFLSKILTLGDKLNITTDFYKKMLVTKTMSENLGS